MKLNFLTIFIFIASISLAQRNDNIWHLGQYNSPNTLYYYYLDFTNGSPDTVMYQRNMHYSITNASICDSLGSALLYTNGIWIANRNNDTLDNSQGFNLGWGTPTYNYNGMPISQGAIVLPVSNKLYYLVYENLEYFNNRDGIPDTQPLSLRYSLIDMSLDNGNGGIPNGFKNVSVLNDTLLMGRLTACRHANGRDWWLISHQYYSNMYYIFLFSINGVTGPFSQNIGTYIPAKINTTGDTDWLGMACFSPDGSKYAMYGPTNIIDLFDFDRCSGLFSNHQAIALNDSSPGMGCSFSSNSRYLYVNSYLNAYQYDTESPNIDSTKIQIAAFDLFVNPFYTVFFLNQLGPDGRIYISPYNYSKILHVIENPDSAGLGANFNQHSFVLPQSYGGNVTLPNFPNYRLGRLIGSSCDTLTGLNSPLENDLRVSVIPNPNSGDFIVNYELPKGKIGTLQVEDLLGRLIYSQPLPMWSIFQHVSLPEQSPGIYVVKISCGYKSSFLKFVKK